MVLASGDLRLMNTNIFSSDWVNLAMSSWTIFPLLLFLSSCAALIQTLPNYICYLNTFLSVLGKCNLVPLYLQILFKIQPVTFNMGIFFFIYLSWCKFFRFSNSFVSKFQRSLYWSLSFIARCCYIFLAG